MTAVPRPPQDLADLREQARAWFLDHTPTGWEDEVDRLTPEESVAFQRDWLRTLNTQGYGAPHVPRRWGGGGYDVAAQAVIYEEWARAKAPPLRLYSVSLHHVPSTLLSAGSADQQQRYVRDAVEGTVWCQGFSEPEAGSDLASLQTRAERTDDGYLLTGRKIWSSNAAFASYGLVLARTSSDGPKHAGISYFIVDMAAPGLEIHPIRQSTGHDHFCEIVLDGVPVAAGDRIGEEGEGWRIAQQTLATERGPIAVETVERINVGLQDLRRALLDPDRDRIERAQAAPQLATLTARAEAVRSLARDAVETAAAGQAAPGLASLVKVSSSELLRSLTDLGASAAGSTSLRSPGHRYARSWISGHWMTDFINSWGWSIASGTNEIQRNIIAERVLGLPREPRP